jgi:hypothetical protein
MRVICTKNELAGIAEPEVRERIRRLVRRDGPITDLAVGQEYAVQALEERDGGLWLYLHTVSVNDYPFPYPVEMFDVRDNTLPAEWSIRMETERGNVVCKRITFSAWADDDHFYERLVDGDAETVALYRRRMASP